MLTASPQYLIKCSQAYYLSLWLIGRSRRGVCSPAIDGTTPRCKIRNNPSAHQQALYAVMLFQIDFLIFDRSPQPLDKNIVRRAPIHPLTACAPCKNLPFAFYFPTEYSLNYCPDFGVHYN